MKSKIPRYFGCVGAVAILLLAVGIVIMPWNMASTPPSTSAEARPKEVKFLKLPETAQKIRYWNDGHNRIAVFAVSEEEFLALFADYEFEEIEQGTEISYYSEGFGDLKNPPRKQGLRSQPSSGLLYSQIEDDGGGETILYDRERKTASYEAAPW